MDPKTRNQIALAIAIACAVAALAWRAKHPDESQRWWKKSAPADDGASDSRGASAPTNGGATSPTSAGSNAGPKLDRKRADEMREAIRAILADAGVAGAWGSSDAPDGAVANAAPTGTFPEMPSTVLKDDAGLTEAGKYIQSRVREDLFPLARECYAAATKKDPKLAGTIILHFRIVGDRRVGGVVDTATVDDKSDLNDPEFAKCMTESMLSVSFDAPPGKSGEVTVTYPIRFSPDDEDEDGG